MLALEIREQRLGEWRYPPPGDRHRCTQGTVYDQQNLLIIATVRLMRLGWCNDWEDCCGKMTATASQRPETGGDRGRQWPQLNPRAAPGQAGNILT